MRKTIVADGKEIVLQTNGLVPLLYKKEFKQDFFADINRINKKNFDIEIFYNLVWVFARVADKKLPDLEEWLAGFEVFPIADYADVIISLVTACITTGNETSKKKRNLRRATDCRAIRFDFKAARSFGC